MIDIVDNLSLEQFRENYLLPQQPVVVRGAVNNWPAIGKWTPDTLATLIKPRTVVLPENQSGATHFEFPKYAEEVAAAERGDGDTPPYFTNANLYEFFPELISDVMPYPEYGSHDLGSTYLLPPNFHYDDYQVELLFGAPGSGFGVLHYDRGKMNAFIAHIYGEKEFILFHPDQGKNVYEERGSCVSPVANPWDPDFDQFPLMREAESARFTLTPGDLAFIPGGWWHTTRMAGATIGVTFNSVGLGNWDKFCAEVCLKLEGQQMQPLKLAALRLYLKLVKYPNVLAAKWLPRRPEPV